MDDIAHRMNMRRLCAVVQAYRAHNVRFALREEAQSKKTQTFRAAPCICPECGTEQGVLWCCHMACHGD